LHNKPLAGGTLGVHHRARGHSDRPRMVRDPSWRALGTTDRLSGSGDRGGGGSSCTSLMGSPRSGTLG
jgi:hypothetical protein